MERCTRVRFSESKFVHDARYIHKYYLPQELRNKTFPVDIDGNSWRPDSLAESALL